MDLRYAYYRPWRRRAERLRIKTLEKKLPKLPEGSRKRHEQARKLDRLRHQLVALEEDKASGKLRLCFGSRKLFAAQNYLEESGFSNQKAWKKEWRRERSNEFFVIGSKGEKAGCQGCQMQSLGFGRFRVALRLPDALVPPSAVPVPVEERRIVFDTVIPYGYQALERSLAAGVSISFRFHKDKNGWRIMPSTDVAAVAGTSFSKGAIGVDLNAGHLALTEVDASGNPVKSHKVPLVTYGLSSEQARARIGNAVKEVIAIAIETRKPLVVEKLDFQKKKRTLKDEHPAYARMLSSFGYSLILKVIKARAFDAGMDVCEVNPAYTSLIGRHKFKKRYGLSTHSAAAAVIARRWLNCCEVPTKGQRFHGTSPAQELRRDEHVWKYYARVNAAERRLHRTSGRQGNRRSTAPTSRLVRGQAVLSGVAGGEVFRHASPIYCSGGESNRDIAEMDKTLCF